MGSIDDDVKGYEANNSPDKQSSSQPSQAGFEGGSNDSNEDTTAPAKAPKGGDGAKMDFNLGEPAEKEPGSPGAEEPANRAFVEKLKFKEVEEVSYPSLDEALDMKFELNHITGMNQRLRNLNCQPRELKELYPAPFQLLTKREKRCKECHKIIIKPNMNPTSNEKMKADFQMIYFVPKVMIYRIGKYTPYKGPD